MRARSLRMIFSVSSPFSVILAASKSASTRPPALARAEWQVVQYFPTSSFCADADIAAAACETAGAGLAVLTVAAGAGLAGDCDAERLASRRCADAERRRLAAPTMRERRPARRA